jgi:4-hydroxy-3-polyprenylbenzoate decarboxylase
MLSARPRCLFPSNYTSLPFSTTLTCRSARLSVWNLKPKSHFPQNHGIRSFTIGNTSSRRKRIVVAVTGATGAPLAVSLLQRLRVLGVETHLILSTWGSSTLKYELSAPNNTAQYLKSLADTSYSPKDVSASLSSGSFQTDGMIVVPCSMKTLAGIRIGYDNDLITRAASVTLKERRKLVLVARETPLSSIHLENMLEVTKAGAVIFPPVMAFYTRPKCVEDMVQQSVRRMVDCLEIGTEEHDTEQGRWTGFKWNQKNDEGGA